ncbi:thiamine pyrophosphate-dependent enzyme [candidate division KSB1 bacterium]
MDRKDFDMTATDIAWCQGCGNFGILNILKRVFAELEIKPENLVLSTGIGQAAKIPQYFKTNYFNGLHGRTLPVATAVKAVNPELTVIAQSGDGCSYGEGGNHFIHGIRRNPNITNIVHDNRVYGLTKGQASPTSHRGFKTPVQIEGTMNEPFNPLAVAIALNASFVSRVFMGDAEKTKEVIKAAIKHKGYALVDVLHPCVTFNKINTYKWFKDNTYYLEDSYDTSDRTAAFERALETEKLPLGIFYINPDRSTLTFEENQRLYREDKTPLIHRELQMEKLKGLIDLKRRN